MGYLIGTDEAGYAPNLGPLVISATVWWVDGDPSQCDLYRRLRTAVCRRPSRAAPNARLAVADSKALYKPPQGLALLERGVLVALALADCCPESWQQAWHVLDREAALHLELPWHAGFDLPLPLEVDADELARTTGRVRRCMERASVRLVAVRSCAVFPGRFNDSTDHYGNKAEALSKWSLRLVAELLPLCAGEPVLIVCDKHGGRNHYGRLLQEQFPDPLIEVHRESLAESTYRWGPAESRVETHFRVNGETFLPAALASMTSKYLRELAMRAFNAYWCGRVPDLRPTAGYPRDARRFKQAIGAAQSELGIDDRLLWRAR